MESRELPVPEHVDIFLLRREMPPSDKTALECVIEVDQERIRLEKEAEYLATKDDVGKSLMDCAPWLVDYILWLVEVSTWPSG